MCYNALWYFPTLIAVGGIVTAAWDVYLRREFRRLRRKIKERRSRHNRMNQENSHERIQSVGIDLPLPTRAASTGLQHRTGDTPIITTTNPSDRPPLLGGPEPARTSTTIETQTPTTDMRSHGILMSTGLIIIGLFFGGIMLLPLALISMLTILQHPSSPFLLVGRLSPIRPCPWISLQACILLAQ